MTSRDNEKELSDTSRKPEKPSKEGQGRPIYDFLYHDEKRVGSLLAQFDSSFGVLGQIRKTQRIAAYDAKEKKNVGTLGVKGALSGAREWRTEHRETADDANELVYDPLWRNAITLVSTMVERDIEVSRGRPMEIGSMFLVRASISILDTDLFSPILADAEMMRSLMNRSKPASQAIGEGEAKLIVAILKGIPRSLQAYIETESGERMWCTMRRESMVARAEEILLKHGMQVPGTWNVLGVLDTAPADKRSANPDAMRLGQLGEALSKLVPVGREIMGRPNGRLGITPVLIYREIS